MRIEKQFAPITIFLNTEEDLKLLQQVLQIAYEQRAQRMWPTRADDSMCQKIRYFKEQLK